MTIGKSIKSILLASLICSQNGCVTDDRFGDHERTNLTMKAFYASSDEPVTRSDNPDEVIHAATQDTLYINDITYLTAEVSDMIHDMPFGAEHQMTADTTALTRGTPIDKSEDLTSLNLVMFNTQLTDFNPTSSAATDLFTVTANKGDFILDKSYAWTAGTTNKHTFIAFSPKTGKNGVTLSANQKSLTYTASATASDHPDICVSDISKNSNVVNTIGSNNHNQRFSMKHALVAIGFEAAGYDLKITKVTIKGVHTTGTLDLITRAWSSLGAVGSRDAGIKDVWLTSDYGSQMSDITNADGYLMMIPQALDNLELIMTFEGRNQQAGASYTIKLKDLGTEWTAGKKIIYQLRLKSKPAVENNALSIADPRAGYTTPAPLSIAASADDNLTFSWAESWLRIHRGNPGYVNPQSGGASSGWVTGVNNWKNIYFFSSADNPSSNAARTATVTVSGKKSGKRTFTITQEKMLTLALSANGPGETIPTTGKTYTIGVTSNTTWSGKEQTGATLSPASGNGNNSSVRIVVPNCASWKDTPVKIAVATTNTVGPQLTRTWTGTQPGVPLSWGLLVLDFLTLSDIYAGSVATIEPRFKAAPDDELTFTWSESWLKVYSGNRVNTVVNPANTGSGSGFKATAAQWNNLWFFASNTNNSVSTRVATVTVKGKKGTTITFRVLQFGRGLTIKDAAYIDCAAGFTSTDLSADTAPDDELTVTWPGDWLKLYVMPSPADNVNVGTAVGSGSGVKVSGRDIGRVRFFATTRNPSVDAERSVTATFTNVYGGKRSVNVTQVKDWSLAASGNISLPFSTGYSANDATSSMRIDLREDPRFVTNDKQINVTYNNNNGPSRNNWFDKDWVRVTNPALNANSTLSFKRNIHPFDRSATIRYEVTYKGTTKTIDQPVTQAAADAWYFYNYSDNVPTGATPTMLIAKEELGNYYWGETWRCSNAYGTGWTLPSREEFRRIVTHMEVGLMYWSTWDKENSSRLPFRDGDRYWTRETGGMALQRYSIYYDYRNWSTKTNQSIKEFNRPYRCVRNW